jgi:hypothetical protein
MQRIAQLAGQCAGPEHDVKRLIRRLEGKLQKIQYEMQEPASGRRLFLLRDHDAMKLMPVDPHKWNILL